MSEEPRGSDRWTQLTAQLRNNFLTGVVVAGPLTLTVILARWFLEWVDSTVKPLIPGFWNPDNYLPFAIPGFGLVVAVVFLTMLGALTASLVGRSLINYGESLLDRMPFVRSVYKTFKQVFETVVTKHGSSFSRVGLIEWPRKGVWAMVFISQPARGEVAARLADGRELLTVFIPTTPNPTGGYIMFVPVEDVQILDMSVEDAAKLVISAGLVVPEDKGAAARRKSAQAQVEELARAAAASPTGGRDLPIT